MPIQILLKGAGGTRRYLSAVVLAETDDKGMKFIKKVRVRGQVLHKKGLDVIIRTVTRVEPMIHQKTLRISINNEDRPVEGVEKNAVCCFIPYTLNTEKQLSEFSRTQDIEIAYGAGKFIMEHFHEGLQSFGFYIVKP